MYQAKSVAMIYGMIHFMVDFCCAFFMFSFSSKVEGFYIGFLIYNFLAFAMQMPVGLLADRMKRNSITAAVGCLFISVALSLLWICPEREGGLWTGLGLAGMGNCLFHVGGGIEVMKESKDEAAPLGIFVSPGAIGIFLGTIVGRTGVALAGGLTCLLAGTIVWLMRRGRTQYCPSEQLMVTESAGAGVEAYRLPVAAAGAMICFFLVVVLRSYLGMIAAFPWKDSVWDGILALLAVFGGKLAGGFAADKLGMKPAAIGTLLTASILFLFSDYMVAALPALFFFNMSMPLTLYLAAKVLRRQNGFAFGILTFAIFIGFLPAYAGVSLCNSRVLLGLSVLSLLFLGGGATLYQRVCCETEKEAADMPEKADAGILEREPADMLEEEKDDGGNKEAVKDE